MTADQRPKLTISVACPTCGGRNRIPKWEPNPLDPLMETVKVSIRDEQCPDCTDGTTTRAVSCQSCKYWSPVTTVGAMTGFCYVKAGDNDTETNATHGCLAWEARKGER